MKVPLRFLACMSFALALVLMLWAAAQTTGWVGRPAAGSVAASPLRLAASSVALGEVALKSETPFEFTVTNTGDQPAQLVGSPNLCVRVGCTTCLDVPTTIPPGRSAPVHFRFKGLAPGPINLGAEMLFDMGTGRIVVVPYTITGFVAGGSFES